MADFGAGAKAHRAVEANMQMHPQMDSAGSRWHPHLDYYPKLDAITFGSEQDYRTALRLFWNDPEFFGVPRDIIADRTVVVPSEIVDLLRSASVNFTHTRVLSASELRTVERVALRPLVR